MEEEIDNPSDGIDISENSQEFDNNKAEYIDQTLIKTSGQKYTAKKTEISIIQVCQYEFTVDLNNENEIKGSYIYKAIKTIL